MDEVIDIPSSPEPPARRGKLYQPKNRPPNSRNQRNRTKAPVVHDDDVIELTDSDSDKPQAKNASASRKKPPTKENSIAGHSRSGNTRLFGSPRANLLEPNPPSQPSSSALHRVAQPLNPIRRPQPRSLPLFLPEDEDEWAVENKTPVEIDENVPETPIRSPPNLKSPSPEPELNFMDGYLTRVIEIIPDVQPTHVLSLLERHIQGRKDDVVELVLHLLFEDPAYPKVDKKGKRKREEVEDDGGERERAKVKVDYGSKDRVSVAGPLYPDIALEQLLVDFPYIPKPHVRRRFLANNGLYAPTYLFLKEEQTQKPLPYHTKSAPSRMTGKGKAKQDLEFDKEREWLLLKMQGDVALEDKIMDETNEQGHENCDDGIECGCCFSSNPFDKMVQCPDCHLFCITCMTSYASNLLGSHDPSIVCMDQSGCKLPFPESELRRFLSPKLMALYERVKQRKEIEAAGLENLEECPFCEYKVVIENEGEKLFRCESADCGAVSCRECKKPDHLPKSCKEMEEDKHLDARHAIEEAMTHALMRNCPKCQKAFVKEHGCNKMTCPNCRTISCYICRAIITGYDHFGNPPPYTGGADPKKCSLWDPVEQRHTDEVRAAANKALEEYKKHHPNMNPEELKAIEVDLPPPAPVAGPAQQLPLHMQAGGMDGMYAANMLAHAQAHARQFLALAPPPLLDLNFGALPALPVIPNFQAPAPRVARAALVPAVRKRRAVRR